MNKYKDIFSYNVVLIKGFKYYFSFTARDEENILDYDQDHEINPRNGQTSNFIDIKNSEGNSSEVKSIPFNYKKEINVLSEARIQFTKSKMNDKNEVALLENIMEFNNYYNINNQYLFSKKNEINEKISKFYE
jgi:hypothetical protein